MISRLLVCGLVILFVTSCNNNPDFEGGKVYRFDNQDSLNILNEFDSLMHHSNNHKVVPVVHDTIIY